jgi:hypothetical protein
MYFIHYSNWNKSWDEWIDSSRILKVNEENLKKQKELLATHGSQSLKKKSRKSGAPGPATEKKTDSDKQSQNGAGDDQPETADKLKASAVLRNNSTTSNLSSVSGSESKRKRQKLDNDDKHDQDYTIKSEITIKMSDELKAVLKDDYQQICTNSKLLKLPSSYTIDMILDDYSVYKIKKQFDKSIVASTIDAIKDHFNALLPTRLLFSFEILQYLEVVKTSNDKKQPTEIYGGIHLLRLFNNEISRSLSYTYWDEICIKQLIFHIEDFLTYINEHRTKVFSSKLYFNPPQSYAQKSPLYTSIKTPLENI